LEDKEAVTIEPKEEKPDIPVEEEGESSSTPTNIGEDEVKGDEAPATPEAKEDNEKQKEDSVEDKSHTPDDSKGTEKPGTPEKSEVAEEKISEERKVIYNS